MADKEKRVGWSRTEEDRTDRGNPSMKSADKEHDR